MNTDVQTVDYIWMGELRPWEEATVHVNLLGHGTVSSVYEGIKGYWNQDRGQLFVFRLDDHLNRFMDSIKMVRLKCQYDQSDLRDAVFALVKANGMKEDCYITPLIYETGIIRMYSAADLDRPTEVVVDMWPFSSQMTMERGVDCCVSSWKRVSDNSSPTRIKCVSNYHNGRLASTEALINGYDLPILLNEKGEVSEGPGACLLLVRHERIVAPPVSADILESITRQTILHLCQEDLGIAVEERNVDRTELYVADEIFFCGTGREVLPVLSVDRLPVGDGKMGSITRAIDKAYHDIVRGVNPKYDQWRTPIW